MGGALLRAVLWGPRILPPRGWTLLWDLKILSIKLEDGGKRTRIEHGRCSLTGSRRGSHPFFSSSMDQTSVTWPYLTANIVRHCAQEEEGSQIPVSSSSTHHSSHSHFPAEEIKSLRSYITCWRSVWKAGPQPGLAWPWCPLFHCSTWSFLHLPFRLALPALMHVTCPLP